MKRNGGIFERAARATFHGLVISVLGLVVSLLLNVYQLFISNKIQQIHMLRQLTSEFYGNNSDPVYRDIRTGISNCQRLYTGDLGLAFPRFSKGQYDYDQINRYLGFFDDVGFYESQAAITLQMTSHSFGAVIIEAYEYPELRKYVDDIQSREPHAFSDFQKVAVKLEELGGNQSFREQARNACKARKVSAPTL